jgi:hypothetical protein
MKDIRSALTFHVNADFMSRTAVFHFRPISICLFFIFVLCVCLCVWCVYSRLTVNKRFAFVESEYKKNFIIIKHTCRKLYR